ncbi:hypothetical protein [Prosthecobacter sp.]|uniref:hypothetical protein n=1 Tax=Prosthecobacter sp. TaxID=1965333 RepID=UPI00378337CC
MKFARLSFLVLISACFTSCGSQTWNAFKNTYPVKFLDQTGSAVLGWLGENNLPTDGKPATMEERARQIESRGHYAGRTQTPLRDAGQAMAAR